MQYSRLGRTGLKVSQLCLGTMTFGWTVSEADSFSIMDYSLDKGINFFDTADIYSRWIDGNTGGDSERIIGKWLKTKDRRQVILATKVRGEMWDGANGQGLSRHHIIQAVEDSLQRLQTNYIDLYQTHWYDAETPIEETMIALDHLVQSGKVRYLGCSNYPAWRLMKSLWASDVQKISRYESIQPHYSLFNRAEFERELAEACLDQYVGVIPYSPLAAGFATGKYTRDNRDPDTTRRQSGLIQKLVDNDDAYNALDVMMEIANQNAVPIAQIALAWLLAKPVVTSPIIGTRSIEQLSALVGATELKLSADDLQRLDDGTVMF